MPGQHYRTEQQDDRRYERERERDRERERNWDRDRERRTYPGPTPDVERGMYDDDEPRYGGSWVAPGLRDRGLRGNVENQRGWEPPGPRGFYGGGMRSFHGRSGPGHGASEAEIPDIEGGLGAQDLSWSPHGGRYAGIGPVGYTRSDDRIKEDVCDRLMAHGEIDASNITVTVEKGEVALQGRVDDRRTKFLAENVVDSVMGVTDVINQLRVRRSGEGREDDAGAGQGRGGSAPPAGGSLQGRTVS